MYDFIFQRLKNDPCRPKDVRFSVWRFKYLIICGCAEWFGSSSTDPPKIFLLLY